MTGSPQDLARRMLLRRMYFTAPAERLSLSDIARDETGPARDLMLAGLAERREQSLALTPRGRIAAICSESLSENPQRQQPEAP